MSENKKTSVFSALRINRSKLLWLMYFLLLASQLEHTAWWFSQSQSSDWQWLSWLLAFAFEGAIAGFTHNLVNDLVKGRENKILFWSNVFALAISTLVSGFANFSHAVQFTTDMKVFSTYPIVHPFIYQFASGATLPLMALIFSVVLAGVAIDEQKGEWEVEREEIKNELQAANAKIKNQAETLGSNIDALSQKDAKIKRIEAELAKYQPLEALAKKVSFDDLLTLFLSDTKTHKIHAVRSIWPGASAQTIMDLTDASASLVSKNGNK